MVQIWLAWLGECTWWDKYAKVSFYSGILADKLSWCDLDKKYGMLIKLHGRIQPRTSLLQHWPTAQICYLCASSPGHRLSSEGPHRDRMKSWKPFGMSEQTARVHCGVCLLFSQTQHFARGCWQHPHPPPPPSLPHPLDEYLFFL